MRLRIQLKPDMAKEKVLPVFHPSQRVDIELELAPFIFDWTETFISTSNRNSATEKPFQQHPHWKLAGLYPRLLP